MTRILCLWLPNWAIQRAIRCRPELKGRPVALVAAGARGGEVAACCGRAIEQGVRPRMPLAEAQALVRDLEVGAYEPPADRRALVKLAEACERFSPRVAVEEGNEPESLLLDISNLEHLYRSEAKLVGRVEKFFTRRGYRVRVAVGETVGAAWALAHFDGERAGSSSSPIQDCNLHFSISSLPIEALRIADDTTALLRQLGIQTVGELMALPREGLASRFGDELLRRLDQLTGRARELIEPQRGVPALEASYALEEPSADRAVLMEVLRQLVDQLARQLVVRDQGAVLLMCLLHLVGGTPGVCDGRGGNAPATPFADPAPGRALPEGWSGCRVPAQGVPPKCSGIVPLRIGLLQPSASARQLLELIGLHLETVRLADEVDRVELRAAVVGRLGERQRELFADRWPTDPHQLAVLVNRLSSRLGYERVLRAELRKSAVPERSVGWRTAVEKKDKEKRKRKDKERGRQGDKEKSREAHSPCLPFSLSPCLSPRPLVFYPAPQAIEVVCVAPDGPPQFVWVGKHRERIINCVGPERIETLWWRGPSVRRDYYRVATQSGSHLWMFRRLTDGRWFVHGVFE